MVSEKLYRNTLSRTRQKKIWSVLENLTVLHCFRLCRLLLVFASCTLTLGRTSKFIPPPWYKGDRGEGGWNPSLEFLICYNTSKRFWLKWKAFDLFNKMRNILWVVELLEGLWRHQQWSPSWPPPWILPRIGNQVKTVRNGDFFCASHKE